jgi:hypothetical protein
MEEEFYATIKLSSGEEIVSKVCYMTDEDSLILDNPFLVEKVVQKRLGKTVEGFSLKEWISSSYDDMFIIKMDQVVTISELDERIVEYYILKLDNVSAENTEQRNDFSREMGYLGSVEDTKKKLETLFNKS